MDWWWVALAGGSLILLTLRDMFHTLWHPTRRGGISRLAMATLWRLSQRIGHPTLTGLVGPLGMMCVVVMWGFMIVLGWALVYWPHMPEGFGFDIGLEPEKRDSLLDSLYFSLVAVGTLGLGDIAPVEGWLRVVAPLEALVGFVLLSAVVTWTLGSYPAIGRRRALAKRLWLMHEARPREGAPGPEPEFGAHTMEGLTVQVVQVREDFAQYPETYYFHENDDRRSLPVWASYAYGLARGAQAAHLTPQARFAVDVLAGALADLAHTLDSHFLHCGGTPAEILSRYAAEHERGR